MKKLLITTAALASLWLLPTACGNDDDGTTPPPTDPDSPEAPIEGYSLYWAEEFDSDDLNPLNWNVETGALLTRSSSTTPTAARTCAWRMAAW